MKTKNLKNIFLLGASMLLAGWSVASCDDSNDWTVDATHDRLFRTSSLAVEGGLSDATVEFKKSPKADYYVIEVSTDSLYDEIAMGGENALVFGEDKSIKASPYVLTNLQKDTKYYIRIKSADESGNESKWAYTEKRYFKTLKEQIVTDFVKTENSMTFSWTPGHTLTTIRVETHNSEEEITNTRDIDISQNQEVLTNCTYTVTGLAPLTHYTVYLLNGEDIKGYVEFQTNAGASEADKTIEISAENPLTQKLIDDFVLEAGVSESNRKTLTITFPADGEWYVHKINDETGEMTNEAANLQIPNGLSVNFYGKGGGAKPIVHIGSLSDSGDAGTTSLKLPGTHETITFYNIVLDGTIYGTSLKVGSVLDTEGCSIGTFSFDDCEIRNYTRCLVRLKAAACMINEVKVSNSLAYNIGGDNYSFMQVKKGEGTITNITFSNSTFYNFIAPMKSFMQFENSETIGEVNITSCTLYKLVNEGQYFIDFKDGGSTVNVTSTIVSNTLGAAKGGRNKKGVTNVVNSYKTNDWDQSKGNAIDGFTDYEGSAKSLFKSPDKGDFTIQDILFEGFNKAGDPRWFTAE